MGKISKWLDEPFTRRDSLRWCAIATLSYLVILGIEYIWMFTNWFEDLNEWVVNLKQRVFKKH